MIDGSGSIVMGESYKCDAVFPDGDIYMLGRNGQCPYVSPETDTLVGWYEEDDYGTILGILVRLGAWFGRWNP